MLQRVGRGGREWIFPTRPSQPFLARTNEPEKFHGMTM